MTRSITVLGMVQGIGFRPFVARLAASLEITGTVCNSGGSVTIIASGTTPALHSFLGKLQTEAPYGAQVLEVISSPLPDSVFPDFQIIQSDTSIDETPILPADLPTCEDCLQELYDTENRRFGYPFISCTACGPRYSIMESIPYDRETTTMDDFPMCEKCSDEYTGNGRRRHAQTISCHACGPQLILQNGSTCFERDDTLKHAVAQLKRGLVLAIKSIGGYQFSCSPSSFDAVNRLRLLKGRPKKPFAIMFPDILSLKEVCFVSPEEEALLTSPARPIVLLEKKTDPFASNVSSESRFLGAFLPYTPLHHLLLDACGPLIMTSGNLAGQPILIKDADMLNLSSPYLDGILYHTRRIHVPLDDSIARVVNQTPQVLRRSRGYVPLPLMLSHSTATPILAMGGDLKASFCLMDANRAYLSQYFGDLEEHQVFESYQDSLLHMEKLLHLSPQKIVCDLHPTYHTTALAQRLEKQLHIPLVPVQHHHAHIVSVMAEHRLTSCIGVTFDGTGYGLDGAIWGGEFLLCRGAEFERVGHLEEISLLGGDEASKDASLSLLCHQYAMHMPSADSRFDLVSAALTQQINTTKSTSMGRLFDVVSALLDLKCYNSYEGECAIALENAAANALQNGVMPYPLAFEIEEYNEKFVASRTELLHALTEAKASPQALALGFHHAIANMVLEICLKVRARTQENTVALSGGVFANVLLVKQCISLLEEHGFSVCINSSVPCNDGGIALGQAWVASYSKDK